MRRRRRHGGMPTPRASDEALLRRTSHSLSKTANHMLRGSDRPTCGYLRQCPADSSDLHRLSDWRYNDFVAMTTRVGNAADFQAVLPMMRKYRLRQEGFDPALYALHPDAEKRFRRWIGAVAEDPRATLLVAEEQGRIIGFLYATIEKNPPIYLHEEFALVREWWVEPELRRRGAGKALIDRAADELARAGVRQVRVRSAAGDEEARAVLHRCGFHMGACEMVKELNPSP